MRICVTSDLHGILPKIEEPCTAVLICGDIMPLRMQRNIPQSEKWLKTEFAEWVNNLPCESVIMVGGNHDFALANMYRQPLKINSILTQPSNHCSFKKNGGQWNEHCVQFSKGAAIHDLLLYGCIGAGIPYEVITKGTLSLLEEYGIKVAPANAKVQYHTIYSSSVGVDVQPDEQVVICGLAGDFCVLETLKNLAPVNPMIFLDGVASLDGGVKLNEYVESNGVRVWS